MKNCRALLAMAIPLALAACTVTPTPPQPLESHLASSERARFASAPPDRPGLGTNWGEKRISMVGTVSFERANFNHPFAAAAIYYNDKAGIRAMTGTVAAGSRFWPSQPRRW